MDAMKEEVAEVFAWNEDGTGKVFCHGEYWNAKGPSALRQGDHVKVTGQRGMELIVKPLSDTTDT
jgi:membrane protein implicated in regulation of membrane protease activity